MSCWVNSGLCFEDYGSIDEISYSSVASVESYFSKLWLGFLYGIDWCSYIATGIVLLDT